MVYGIGLTSPERRQVPRGRERLPPSTPLRTLAWLRYLLNKAGMVRHWAQGLKPEPPGWRRRSADADLLRTLFGSNGAPFIDPDPYRRPVSLLDDVFTAIKPSLARWFSDKARRGLIHPDGQQLKRIDDLVPGSARRFTDVPKGLDPGFYDALDFTSVWFGRLHLWRVIDPEQRDSAWERLLEEGHVMEAGDERIVASGFPYGAWRRRLELWQVRPAERRRLRDEIALAMVHLAFPDEVDDRPDFGSPRRRLRAARAACERDASAPNPIRDRIREWSEPRQWRALTDAMAAARLERIAILGDGFARWWVESAAEGMAPTIAKMERAWFCSLANGGAPLRGFVSRVFKS